MIHVLIKQIPHILFEPYAIAALLGCLFAFIWYFRRKSVYFWIFFLSILFMIFWRILGYSLMVSTRYSVILVYPAIIFTAWLFCKLQSVSLLLLKKYSTISKRQRERIASAVTVLCVIGFAIASLIKTFHINIYHNYTEKVCQTFTNCPKQGEIHLYAGREAGRIAYYTGYDKIENLRKEREIPEYQLISQLISKIKNVEGDHFFFVFHKSSDLPLSQDSLKIQSQAGSFETVAKAYTARNRKTEFILYRFSAKCPNIKKWNNSVIPAAAAPTNLCRNGNFELPLTGKPLSELQKRINDLGLEEYEKNKSYPAHWAIGLIEANKDNPPVITLSEKNPIEGHFSMFADSRHTKHSAAFSTHSIPVCDCKYSLFVRGAGKETTKMSIELRSYVPELKKSVVPRILYFQLEPGQTYRIQDHISKSDFPHSSLFCLSFVIKGAAFVDALDLSAEYEKTNKI